MGVNCEILNDFLSRWVDVLLQGPRPLILEASGNAGMQDVLDLLLSKKGLEVLTGEANKSIANIYT